MLADCGREAPPPVTLFAKMIALLCKHCRMKRDKCDVEFLKMDSGAARDRGGMFRRAACSCSTNTSGD